MPHYRMESQAGGRVAGVDEAGRGPLAGPVMAAAVVFTSGVPRALGALLDDSKKLSATAREAAFAALLAAAAQGQLHYAVAAASATEIGQLNILRATHLAMARAIGRLGLLPDLALVDGNQAPPLPCRVHCVIGGDAESFSIAAASILAKVIRDRAMARLHPRWPLYGFASHAGYPTARHRAALAEHGPCPHHRRGFAPVDRAWLLAASAPG
jgi:ribonuclease HII